MPMKLLKKQKTRKSLKHSIEKESFQFYECSEVTGISLRRKLSDALPPASSKRATVDLSLLPSMNWPEIVRTTSSVDILPPRRNTLIDTDKNSSLPDVLKTPKIQLQLTGKNDKISANPEHSPDISKLLSRFETMISAKNTPPLTRRASESPTCDPTIDPFSTNTNYMSKMEGTDMAVADLFLNGDEVFFAQLCSKTPYRPTTISRSISANESRLGAGKRVNCELLRNASKSRSLKIKGEPLLKQMVRKVMPFKGRSSSDSHETDGGSLFHRRQSEIGGSAPSSPQTATKLPKIPSLWKKASNAAKDKGRNEGSEESLTDKEWMSSHFPSPTPGPGNSGIAPINGAPSTLPNNCSVDDTHHLKNYSDHELRRSNTLKIWIQEAKDIPDKRGYYCQLLLNNKKGEKTTTKMKNGLCFWGEQFVMSNIPEGSKIGLRLMRKDKEKEKLVGTAEFVPEPTVQEPRLDRWIPLLTEKQSKEKENPALRCRYFLQKVTILPLVEYNDFVKYLKESALAMCRKLEGHLNVKTKEDIVKLLISVLQHHKKAVSFLGQLIISDVEDTGMSDELMFRGNSMATKAIEAYMKLVSTQYLKQTLQRTITSIINTNKTLEVDPNKISPTEPGTVEEYRCNLEDSIKDVWNSILKSSKDFPVDLQQVFFVVRARIKRPELSDPLISSCVFLRLLCPAILSPYLFSLIKEYPETEANRRLTLVAKTIQTLANFTTYQTKENCMQFLNIFIQGEQENCRQFLRKISGPLDPRSQPTEPAKVQEPVKIQEPAKIQEPIDIGLHLALLHIHLKHAVEAISREALEDSVLRRLKLKLDFLTDCLDRHEKSLRQQDFDKIAYAGSSLACMSANLRHKSLSGGLSPKQTRRPFSTYKNSELMIERSVSCRAEYEPRYESTGSCRIPASDLNTSDTYVHPTALGGVRNSARSDNNVVNNNVIPTRPDFRSNIGIIRGSQITDCTTDNMAPNGHHQDANSVTSQSLLPPNLETSRQKQFIKSMST